MIEVGYVYVACGLVLLAIGVNVLIKFDAESWLTSGLRRGDLYSLSDVASGLRPDGLNRDQAHRLQIRGMVRGCGNGNFRATIRGRVALRMRQVIRGRSVA